MSEQSKFRDITTRIVVTGALYLLTPTHLGNGDAESLTDLPLLLDTAGESPLPLLTGASIAGALRNYVRVCEQGYFQAEKRRERNSLSVLLFGAVKGDTGTSDDQSDPGGEQSRLIIDDALGTLPEYGIEIRDGVRIDGKTRTAQDKFKFDLELLPAGTTFPLRFELLISEDDDAVKLKEALALALHGLETGAISIGARKTRGFGRCQVHEWRVTTYNLRDSHADLLAWLATDHAEWGFRLADDAIRVGKAADVVIALPEDTGKRHAFTIKATFALESPLLIRSEEPLTDGDSQSDFAHIRDSSGVPIIPGTSLAGVLRARATRILNTIKTDITQGMVNSLFGKDMQVDPIKPTASRLLVAEAAINDGRTLVQNRVAIDRFTGGAFDTALFSEAPQVGGDVTLTLTIRNPSDAEKGLLLLLLKDLWTGDLSIGGTSSIGRGRLRGLNATVEEQADGTTHTWTISEAQGRLSVGDEVWQAFEQYVTALNELEAKAYA